MRRPLEAPSSCSKKPELCRQPIDMSVVPDISVLPDEHKSNTFSFRMRSSHDMCNGMTVQQLHSFLFIQDALLEIHDIGQGAFQVVIEHVEPTEET